MLSDKAKKALDELKATAEKDVYRKAEDAAEVLAATVQRGGCAPARDTPLLLQGRALAG